MTVKIRSHPKKLSEMATPVLPTDSQQVLNADLAAHCAHLPLPSGTSEQDNIPYRCTEPYDRGSFLDYPDRTGWPQAVAKRGQPSFLQTEIGSPSDDTRLEDFFQRWLFFGMLHEFLGSKYDESRYVTHSANASIVHTRHLKGDVDIWRDDITRLNRDEGDQLYRNLQQCLSLADDVLVVADVALHPGFNRGIRQSIALLCDAIVQVVEKSLPQPDGCKLPVSWKLMYSDMQTLSTLKDNNWCQSEALMLDAKTQSSSTIYFSERLKRPSLGRDHNTCSPDVCQFLTIDDKTYRTQHVKDGCDCSDVSIALSTLASVLDQGALPLLRLDLLDATKVNVTVEPYSTSKAYVALSHVWADGLGNKKANSLPTCQLYRLGSLLKNLHGRPSFKSKQPETRELSLWCDTLCVPVENKNDAEQTRVRNLAMTSMREVYYQSSYVLVLDRTFSSSRLSDIGTTEAAIRVMTSPWTQRLWTYQEAVLPENLLFQFADTTIDIREIWQHSLDQSKQFPLLYGLSIDIIAWCATIRQPFRSAREKPIDLITVIQQLKGRRLSYAADESLCLSTIFDIDASSMTGSQQERMACFWRQKSLVSPGIPRAIIFNGFPRLQMPGLRWAPSTLLHDPGIEHTTWTFNKEGSDRQAQLTDGGLMVDYRAFRARRAEPARVSALTQPQRPLEMQGIIQCRDLNGVWYNLKFSAIHEDVSLSNVYETVNSGNEDMTVLISDQLGDEGNYSSHQHGLLTVSVESEIQPAKLQSLATVHLTTHSQSEQMIWTAAYKLAGDLRASDFILQMQTQAQLPVGDSAPDPKARDPVEEVLMELLKRASIVLDQSPAMLELIQGMGQKNPQGFLTILAHRIFFGQYWAVQEKFDAGQVWCVD